jgi:hypothetical protein
MNRYMIQESVNKYIDDTDDPARSETGWLSAVINFQCIKIVMQKNDFAAKNQIDDNQISDHYQS